MGSGQCRIDVLVNAESSAGWCQSRLWEKLENAAIERKAMLTTGKLSTISEKALSFRVEFVSKLVQIQNQKS